MGAKLLKVLLLKLFAKCLVREKSVFHIDSQNNAAAGYQVGDKCNPSYFYFCLRSHGEKKVVHSGKGKVRKA